MVSYEIMIGMNNYCPEELNNTFVDLVGSELNNTFVFIHGVSKLTKIKQKKTLVVPLANQHCCV